MGKKKTLKIEIDNSKIDNTFVSLKSLNTEMQKVGTETQRNLEYVSESFEKVISSKQFTSLKAFFTKENLEPIVKICNQIQKSFPAIQNTTQKLVELRSNDKALAKNDKEKAVSNLHVRANRLDNQIDDVKNDKRFEEASKSIVDILFIAKDVIKGEPTAILQIGELTDALRNIGYIYDQWTKVYTSAVDGKSFSNLEALKAYDVALGEINETMLDQYSEFERGLILILADASKKKSKIEIERLEKLDEEEKRFKEDRKFSVENLYLTERSNTVIMKNHKVNEENIQKKARYATEFVEEERDKKLAGYISNYGKDNSDKQSTPNAPKYQKPKPSEEDIEALKAAADEKARIEFDSEEHKLKVLKEFKKEELSTIKAAADEKSKVEFESEEYRLKVLGELRKSEVSSTQSATLDIVEAHADQKESLDDLTTATVDANNIIVKNTENATEDVSKNWDDHAAKIQENIGHVMDGINSIFSGANAILQDHLDEATEKYQLISEEYDNVVKKRSESNDRIEQLEQEAHNATGARLEAIQAQIKKEMETNKQLATQEEQLAKEKEKAEKEIQKKEKEIKKSQLSQNIIQGISNVALSITKAFTAGPFIGQIMAGIAAAAGAVQVGILTKQLSKLEDGGLLRGKRHAQGGMRVAGTNIEVEGGEYVVNREATGNNLGLIRYINSRRKELTPSDLEAYFAKSNNAFEAPMSRMFAAGGQLPAITSTDNMDSTALVDAIRSIKFSPKVAVTDIIRAQDDMASIDGWSGM